MDELSGYRPNYEEYPSFDDQNSSHLSRNPSKNTNNNKQQTNPNNNNNNNNNPNKSDNNAITNNNSNNNLNDNSPNKFNNNVQPPFPNTPKSQQRQSLLRSNMDLNLYDNDSEMLKSNQNEQIVASSYSNLNAMAANDEQRVVRNASQTPQRKPLPTYSQLSIPNALINSTGQQMPANGLSYQNSLKQLNNNNYYNQQHQQQQQQTGSLNKSGSDYLKYDNNWSMGSPVIGAERRVPSPSPTRLLSTSTSSTRQQTQQASR